MDRIQKMYEKGSLFPIVYSMKDLDKALECRNSGVVLMGRMLNILNSRRVVQYVKNSGKTAIVDIDLVGGLDYDEYGLNFIAKEVGADGVISTHKNTIINAKKKKLITILKVFAYDDHSLNSAMQIIDQCEPDVIELLPGIVLPLVIDRIKAKFDVPVDASGFMNTTREGLLKLMDTGVSALHTGDAGLWNIELFSETRRKNR